jgi:dienelactone hydrolase
LGQFLLCILLAACTLPANSPQQLDRVWEYAYVYFPKHPDQPVRMYEIDFKTYAAEQEGQKPLPAVVFLHGCEGFKPTFWEANFPIALAKAGYVVFVPDSFARPDRKQACHFVRWNTLVLRHAEIDDARQRLQRVAWVDQRNLFLAGHSEGGMATATYDGPAFNAYYISGWTCASREPSLNPLHMPKDSPVLTVLGDKDEYYPGNNGVRHCGDRMAGRPNAKSVIMPGYDHGGVPRDPAMGLMLSEFFDQYRVAY